VVAEDLCFSIAARDAGYFTVFAPDVVCEEEFPVDYTGLQEAPLEVDSGQHGVHQALHPVILRSRMTWFEKLDIVLFTYSLPLTAVFSVYVAIHVIVLPHSATASTTRCGCCSPTALFLVAPMLNDVIFHFRGCRSGRWPPTCCTRFCCTARCCSSASAPR
jgi:hypothetical protein